MSKNKVETYLRRAGNKTLDKPMAPCSLAMWAFALDGNIVKSNRVYRLSVSMHV